MIRLSNIISEIRMINPNGITPEIVNDMWDKIDFNLRIKDFDLGKYQGYLDFINSFDNGSWKNVNFKDDEDAYIESLKWLKKLSKKDLINFYTELLKYK